MDKLFIIKLDTASYQANNLLCCGCRFLRVQARSGILKSFRMRNLLTAQLILAKLRREVCFRTWSHWQQFMLFFSVDLRNRGGIPTQAR